FRALRDWAGPASVVAADGRGLLADALVEPLHGRPLLVGLYVLLGVFVGGFLRLALSPQLCALLEALGTGFKVLPPPISQVLIQIERKLRVGGVLLEPVVRV